ncbi:MAG TPA: hypothetical protein VH575_25380 [Gemmataceae bacterium]|jgi:hypothetical protein
MSIEQDVLKTPQPTSRQVRIEEVDGGLELSSRQRPWGTAGFLLLWWTGWTAVTGALLWMVLTEPSVMHVLFAFPFVTAWSLALVLLVWMLFGTERVRLSSEGLEYYRAILFLTLSRCMVPRTELKGVREGLTAYQVNDKNELCLKFETMGQPLQFAAGISEEEQRWLVERLNEYLDMLGPHGSPNRRSAAPIPIQQTSHGEILETEALPVEPPSDSRIGVRYGADTIAFVWQGEWSLAAIARMTFIHLFWNGIVSVFICKQVEDFNWLLFFFMIPHEVIGLCLFAGWLAALTAPLWRLTWTFGERQTTRRLSISDADAIVFALGWKKRFTMQPPIRIALRRREEKKQSGSFWELLSHPDGEYTLSFLGSEDKELLAIKYLTEGDARWIADVLPRVFPSWSQSEQPIPTT